MSSFKRRTPSKQAALAPGTRACPISISTVLTSSGIPSLDDILGGGIPLSCSLAVLAPDPQSAYGELVQKYFVAQGIASGHKVCIAHEDALSFVKECMWTPTSNSSHSMPIATDEDDAAQGEKIKIAWRYEQMKRFETTVANPSKDDFCATFDLTCRIPMSVINDAWDAKKVVPISLDVASPMGECMTRMKDILAATPSTEVVRVCIATLGSPEWGEHSAEAVLSFLYSLRRLLRRYPHACACVSLAPHLCADLWQGPGWVDKVGWVTDGAITMSGFGANPALTTLFPSHHGFVQIHKLPAPQSILPTSDKCSTLRGLSSSAGAGIGTGENNLAFKCMRKRLVIETMHLDVEGGVGERRTTPSSTAIGLDVGRVHTDVSDGANVMVGLEGHDSAQQSKKAKKKVAFHSDRPELYDF